MRDIKVDIEEKTSILGKRYILRGKKVVEAKSLDEWAKFFDSKKRFIKQQTINKKYWISSVFLGLPSCLSYRTEPLIFETMVFKKDKKGKVNFTELDMDRYSTYDECIKGHKAMVKKWRVRK